MDFTEAAKAPNRIHYYVWCFAHMLMSFFEWVSAVFLHVIVPMFKPSYQAPSPDEIRLMRQEYKIPSCIGLVCSSEDVVNDDDYYLLERVIHIIRWSSLLGVKHILVYDEEGHLIKKKSKIEKLITLVNKHSLKSENYNLSGEKDDKEVPTNNNDAINNSYNLKLTNGFIEPVFQVSTGHDNGSQTNIHFLSGNDGRGHIVRLAREYVKLKQTVTLDELEKRIANDFDFPDPELVIRMNTIPCLYSFLPWQIRLSEIIGIDDTGYRGKFLPKLKDLETVVQDYEKLGEKEYKEQFDNLKETINYSSLKVLDNLKNVLERFSKCEQRFGK